VDSSFFAIRVTPYGSSSDTIRVSSSRERIDARAVAEVIEREPVAATLERADGREELAVERLRVADLDSDEPRWHDLRESGEDELARYVDPRRLVGDDPLEADLREGVQNDRGGRALGTLDERLADVSVSEQELVANNHEPAVEDRLSCNEDVGHVRRDADGNPNNCGRPPVTS
jgi:hypothetical protein